MNHTPLEGAWAQRRRPSSSREPTVFTFCWLAVCGRATLPNRATSVGNPAVGTRRANQRVRTCRLKPQFSHRSRVLEPHGCEHEIQADERGYVRPHWSDDPGEFQMLPSWLRPGWHRRAPLQGLLVHRL